MKSHIRVLALITALLMFQGIFSKQAAAQPSSVSFQVFYDQLSPYGQWINNPDYGYVWIPDAGPDFVPYSSNGYWALTDFGWTWSSDFEWGWAPFHYGRWDYDNYYGWFWIPDNLWGPAWVTWRRAEGYYGWEPMGPGITIGMSFGNNFNTYNGHWTFVNDRYFGRNDAKRYYVNQSDHERIFRNSTIINNTIDDNRRQIKYVSGPDRAEVRRVTGRNIQPYTFQENNGPGQKIQNGVFRTYRPDVKSNAGDQMQPAPARVTNVKDVRKPTERNSSGLQNKNTGSQQQEIVKQQNNTRRQQVVVKEQNDTKRQQNTQNQQEVVKQQNTQKQQEVVKQQNNTKQQEVVKQQTNTRRQQEVVKQQNNTKQKNATKKTEVKTGTTAKKEER